MVEFLHFDIQSTGQKSHCVNTRERHHNAWFLLNCRIPLVRFSSELAANCTGGPQRSDFRRYPAHELPRNRSISLVFTPGSCTQPSEPILFPKLRIYFADFPYLHYSIRPEAANLGDLMRLLVRLDTKYILTWIFKDHHERT